jgi:thiamine transporter 2/3
MDYLQLNYLSLGFITVAFGFALFLPSVKKSIYFHRQEDSEEAPSTSEGGSSTEIKGLLTFREKVVRTKSYIVRDLKVAYSNGDVLKWSLWWAVATSGHLQVINFIQALWETIVNSENSNVDSQVYNGATEAIHTLLSM